MKSNDINNNPWLALATYEEHDHHKFIGRDNDVENLTNLLRQNECIVCYAASGEGKSSLINAGLFPRLKIVNYFPIKISFTVEDEKQKKNSVIDFDELVFSKIEDYLESYNEEIDKRINEFEKEEEKVFLSKFKVKFEALSRYNDVELPDSLWWKLRTRTIHTYAGTTYTPVLIFDQFEEIFRTKWKKDFFKWLEILMKDKCPDENIDDNLITERKLFKVLFSMRHEYVGELDYWCSQRTYIPQMMRNRYFLKPLTTEQARSIILGQDYKNENIEKKFKDNADAIIDICKNRDGDANADEVSAIVLSLVGSVSYDEWSKNDSYSIQENSYKDAIYDYYKNKMEEAGISSDVRFKIEEALGCENRIKQRVSVNDQDLEDLEFNKKYKDSLVKSNIIRVHALGTEQYVEFTHDRLVEAIYDKHKVEKLQRRNKRLFRVSIIAFALLSIITVLFVNLKRNEKNYLITQAKYIAAEAEKLAEEGDRYDCIRLLKHVAENNRMSLKTPDFEHAIRSLDCNYKFPEKNWLYASYIKTIVFSPDGEKILITSNNSRINDYTSKIWSVESGECLQSIKHTHFVTMGEYSPNGEYVVTASDSFSKIWSAKDGKCIQTMLHNGKVNSSKFSPDGKYVVTASDDKTSKLWSVESGECLDTMQHEARVESATFSPDGRYIVTMSDKTTKLWDVESKKCLQTKKYDISLYSANFTPNSSYVITRVHSHKYDKSYCSLWDIENGENMLDTKTDLHSIKFSPSHKYVVTATKEGDVKMWMNGNCDFLHDIHNVGSADRVSFSHDEKYILTYSGKMVRLWSINKGKYIDSIPHNKNIRFARFSPDSKYIITTTFDHNVRLWLVESEDICSEINRDFNEIVEISPDDKYILTKSKQNDTLVKFWSVEDMKCIKYMQHEEAVTSARFSPKGDYLLTVSNGKNSNNVNLWSIENKECVHTMEYNNWISSAEFSSDGKIIVAADNNSKSHNVVLWSVDGRVCLDTISFKEWVDYVEFGFDTSFIIIKSKGKLMVRKNGKQLDALSDTNNYRIIKFSKDDNKVFISESGQPYLKLLSLEDEIIIDTINKDKEYVSSLSIGPNGNCFVSNSSLSKHAILWSANGEKQLKSLNHDSGINSAFFSPDGRYIVTASDDNTSKLWSVESGECLQTIQHEDDVKSAVFSPDGRYIVTASDDKVRIIPIKPLSEILDKWSETLGPNAELTKEEKAKYFLN